MNMTTESYVYPRSLKNAQVILAFLKNPGFAPLATPLSGRCFSNQILYKEYQTK